MIWKTVEFEVPLPPAQTHAACLGAAERLGWKVGKDKPDRLRLAIPPSVYVHLGRVEIKLGDRGSTTAVKAKGSNHDDGPLARSKLREHLQGLEEAIRLEAEGRPSPT